MLELKTYKNYKELCVAMDWKITGGSYKTARLKELNMMCKWNKDGNKIIIKEIFKIKKDKIDKRVNIEYIEYIKLKILTELVQSGENKNNLIYSKGKWFKSCGLTNINYNFSKNRSIKTSLYLGISCQIVTEYFQNVDKMLLGNFERALKQLRSQRLIMWNAVRMIAKNKIINNTERYEKETYIDEYGEMKEDYMYKANTNFYIQEATDEEKEIVVKCENSVLNSMECNNMKDVFLKGSMVTYYNRVNELIKNYIPEYRFTYKAYKINYNYETIAESIQLQLKELLEKNKSNKLNVIQLLNSGVKDKIVANAKNRRNKQLNEGKIKYKYRETINYINNYIKLNDNMIDVKAKNICDDILKTIINKDEIMDIEKKEL